MSLDHASAGDLLDAFGRAWASFDGDLIVSLFTEDGEYHEDPFGPALVGHNAIRAYWLAESETTSDVEFQVERHWVAGDTVLAAWHASYRDRGASVPTRLAGFMTWAMAPDGRIARLREWLVTAPAE